MLTRNLGIKIKQLSTNKFPESLSLVYTAYFRFSCSRLRPADKIQIETGNKIIQPLYQATSKTQNSNTSRSICMMPPKKANLRKFFGKPKGNQSPVKQSTLSFLSQTSCKDNVGQDLKEQNSEVNREPIARIISGKPETRKRSRSPESSSKISSEEVVKSGDDSDPVTKRRRTIKIEDCNEVTLSTKLSKVKDSARSKKTEAIISLPATQDLENSNDKLEDVDSFGVDASSESSSNNPKIPARQNTNITDIAEKDDLKDKEGISDEFCVETEILFKSKSRDPFPDWKPGEPVPYAALCTTFSLIEMTSKRLVIASHCSLFLRQVLRLTPEDLLPTVLLMVNKLAADYLGIELGIGESLIMKAIGESTGRSLNIIKEDQKEIGDLGLVAVKSRARQPTMFAPKPLTIRSVHQSLIEIATVTGQGAQSRKIDLIKKILSSADAKNSGTKIDIYENKGGASEAKFIVRFLEGRCVGRC